MNRDYAVTVTVDDEKGVRTYRCDESKCRLVGAYEETVEFC